MRVGPLVFRVAGLLLRPNHHVVPVKGCRQHCFAVLLLLFLTCRRACHWRLHCLTLDHLAICRIRHGTLGPVKTCMNGKCVTRYIKIPTRTAHSRTPRFRQIRSAAGSWPSSDSTGRMGLGQWSDYESKIPVFGNLCTANKTRSSVTDR